MGQTLEKEIVKINAGLLEQGIAKIHKTDPPISVLRGSRTRIIMKKNPFLDFAGVLRSSCRMIVFEAKETKQPRLRTGEGTSGIEPDQLTLLDDWEAAGAISFLIWRYVDTDKKIDDWRVLTLQEIRDSIRSGDKSIKPAVCPPLVSPEKFLEAALVKLKLMQDPAERGDEFSIFRFT